jgi:hypothetical protein
MLMMLIPSVSGTIYAQNRWVRTLIAGRVNAVACNPQGVLYAFTTGGSLIIDTVYCSLDTGATWSRTGGYVPGSTMAMCFNSKGDIFVGNSSSGIFRSTDNGVSWKTLNQVGSMSTLSLVINRAGQIFAGDDGGVIYRSTDSDTVWTNLGTFGGMVMSIAIDSTGIISAAVHHDSRPSRVVQSVDNGYTWTQLGADFGVDYVSSLALSSGGDIFLATGSLGVLRYGQNNQNWTQANSGITHTFITSLLASGTILFAGYEQGVYLSPNNGENWYDASDGIEGNYVNSFAVCGTSIFAGTREAGVWMRKISNMITTVNAGSHEFVKAFSLGLNYPNPFNPSTTISFSLPSRSFVTLKIFDVMGRDVATIASEEFPSGSYSRTWNAKGVPSGVYFYRLQADAYSETKRLVLLR